MVFKQGFDSLSTVLLWSCEADGLENGMRFRKTAKKKVFAASDAVSCC